ncbi:MAG: TRAP transporter small permease [Spirochaetes bacterium]|nr:TRAP transporter small permease [Spirochaetota bacterium]
METLRRIVDQANSTAKWLCYGTATIMIIMVVLQVLFRYVIKVSLSFSEELARFMFIWTVFLGSTIALRQRAHVSIEILVARLPKTTKRWFITLANTLSFVFYLTLIVYGIVMVTHAASQTSPALGLSMGYVYLSVPVSGVLFLLNHIVNAWDEYLHPEIIKSEGGEE